MNAPDLSKIVETFIPISTEIEKNSIAVWQDYADMLRTVVSPLVRDRQAQGEIAWYSFLVHNRESGVPTDPRDNRHFIHLRMEVCVNIDEEAFISGLPSVCLMTKKMQVTNPSTLDTVDIFYLANEHVEEGWKVLGESSEWVLSMLQSHDAGKKVPPQNVAQFLHYIGNQLLVSTVRIPMP